MPSLRSLSRRDVVLVLTGITFTHLLSVFFSLSSFPSSIVINTRYDTFDTPSTQPHVKSSNCDSKPQWPQLAPLPDSASMALPETSIIEHAPGWTLFRNVYMSNGTLFIVSSKNNPSQFPDIRLMTSTSLPAENTPENIAAREPTSDNMRVIGIKEALRRWGGQAGMKNRVWEVEGGTVLINDPAQFLGHYYHFVAELLLGTWAFWTGAFAHTPFDTHDLSSQHRIDVLSSKSKLQDSPYVDGVPPIHRIIFAHSSASGWRDGPGLNAYFLRAAFPSLAVEVQEDWADRVRATEIIETRDASTAPLITAGYRAEQLNERAWLFPTLLLADRSAAFRGNICPGRTQRTASEAYEPMWEAGRLRRGWWEPVRRAVVRFAGVDEVEMPAVRRTNMHNEKVVITYISRQGTRRRLLEKDHEALVHALAELVKSKGSDWELNILQAERVTRDEQIRIAGRSTIILGVHGNGLSHLVLIPLTSKSTVIELFYPGGFTHDYEWTTRALGMRHFAVWNNTYRTEPNTPSVDYPEGFQGPEIPVYGPTVVEIIEGRVEGRL